MGRWVTTPSGLTVYREDLETGGYRTYYNNGRVHEFDSSGNHVSAGSYGQNNASSLFNTRFKNYTDEVGEFDSAAQKRDVDTSFANAQGAITWDKAENKAKAATPGKLIPAKSTPAKSITTAPLLVNSTYTWYNKEGGRIKLIKRPY